MTVPEHTSRFALPISIRLLLSAGMKTHTLFFGVALTFMFAAGFIGRLANSTAAWPVIFATGASIAGTYAVLALLAFTDQTRNLLLNSQVKTRIILVSAVLIPILTAISYWIWQAGSVESLPVFPAFLIVFYGWILLQAYFVASPVTHGLIRVERKLPDRGYSKKLVSMVGIMTVFLPIVSLVYGAFLVSQSISSLPSAQGRTGDILFWIISVSVLMLVTYFLVASWGWMAIRQGKPQAAIFAGGTFAILWVYLLYRASTLLLSYLSETQPANALADIGLMLVSIFGAMQTFARKTMNNPDRRWSQVFPFLVFSFGSIYAVSQLYFVLQFAITRAELAVAVNAIVLGSGILTMLILIRRHVLAYRPLLPTSSIAGGNTQNQADDLPQTEPTPKRANWLKWPFSKEKEPSERHDDDY